MPSIPILFLSQDTVKEIVADGAIQDAVVCGFHGHHAGDPLNYREKEEVERWRQHDPIERVKSVALERGVMTQAEIDDLEKRIEAQIEEAVEFAKNSPDPTPDQLMTDIYA